MGKDYFDAFIDAMASLVISDVGGGTGRRIRFINRRVKFR
jgi:hypothetical protein